MKTFSRKEGGLGIPMDLEEQYQKIYRYCYFKLHDPHLAEDITQETFLRFYESVRYREKGQKLQYLYRIAHNLCTDAYRSARYRSEPLTDELFARGSEEELLLALTIRRALQKLPPEEQELLLLRYVNQVPVSDLCGILHISRFALYRRLKKAREDLRKILGEDFL